MRELTFLSFQTVPPTSLLVEAYDHGSLAAWMPMLLYAVPIGVGCAFVTAVGMVGLGVGKRLGQRTHFVLARLGGRNLGLLLTPVVGGALLGLIAKGCPLVMGEGSVQLEALWLEPLSARQQLKIELEALGL